MYRALTKILVALALAMGLTYAVGGTATAAPAERHVATRAAACSTEKANSDRAQTAYRNWVRATAKARAAYKKAQRVERKAASKKAKKRAHVKTVKARKKLVVAKRRTSSAKSNAVAKTRAYNNCRAANNNTPTPQPSPTASPIQALCNTGIPQVVCDTLATLIPSGSVTSPLSQLCSAAPQTQQLCTLLTSGPSVSAGDLQVVLDQIVDGLPDPLNLLFKPVLDLLKSLGILNSISPTQLQTLITQLGLNALP